MHPLQIGKKLVLWFPNDVHDVLDALLWVKTTAMWFKNVFGVHNSLCGILHVDGHTSIIIRESTSSFVPRLDPSIDTFSIFPLDLSLIQSTFFFVTISLQKVVPSTAEKPDNMKGVLLMAKRDRFHPPVNQHFVTNRSENGRSLGDFGIRVTKC